MTSDVLTSARYARVLRLLDLERKIILNGPLSGLAPIVEQREAAVSDLLADGSDLPEAFLLALKARAERNSRLILASLAGVKAAADQMAEAIAQSRLRTYTSAGDAIDVTPAVTTRDQRA